MSTLAYYNIRDMEIDLARLPRWLYEEIASLHGRCTKDDPAFTCLANGQPMSVWRHRNGRYFLKHYPGGAHGGHTVALGLMSDEHRNQTEYCQRAADRAGLRTILEHPTVGRTRLDLAVVGAEQAGIEIQHSHLSRAAAKSRARRSLGAGWPTAWVTDTMQDPDWADHVPTARLTVRGLTPELDWSAMPRPHSAKVAVSMFKRVREGARWSFLRSPTAIHLDELPVLMAAGEILPVRYGSKGFVVLADKASAVLAEELAPGSALWDPGQADDFKRRKETFQTKSLRCVNPHAARCSICTGELETGWAITNGICNYCELDRQRRSNYPKGRFA